MTVMAEKDGTPDLAVCGIVAFKSKGPIPPPPPPPRLSGEFTMICMDQLQLNCLASCCVCAVDREQTSSVREPGSRRGIFSAQIRIGY